MVNKTVLECSFFIPIRRDANLSDGKDHTIDAWEWLDGALFDWFDGGTEAPGHYHGFYRDPQTAQRVADESRKFIVAVSEDQLDDLRTLLAEACEQFQQKYIYLSVAGRVEFVEATNRGNHEKE